MHKTFLTAILTLCFGLFLVTTASAALTQYSGSGRIYEAAEDNAYGLNTDSSVSWSVTFDPEWNNGFITLNDHLNDGASLKLAIGDWTFTYDKNSPQQQEPLGVFIDYGKNPHGFSFKQELGETVLGTDKFFAKKIYEFSFFESQKSEYTVQGLFDFSNMTQSSAANAVPIPGAVWLLGTGMVALAGLRRKFTR